MTDQDAYAGLKPQSASGRAGVRHLRFNPFAPGYSQDPYPTYAELRRSSPVHRTPFGPVVVSRHTDVVAVLRDARLGVDARKSPRYAAWSAAHPEAASAAAMLESLRPFIFLDPPAHTRLRRLVVKAFTPRAVARLQESVSLLVDDMLSTARERGAIDVIADLADPLPTRVVSELLGIPQADHELVRTWTRHLTALVQFNLLPETDPALLVTIEQAVRHLQGLVRDRRASSQADLISALVTASDEGQLLTDDEIVATCLLLLVAGQDTTVNLIGNGTLALATQPVVAQQLRQSPELWPAAVEELLRFDAPVQMTARVALEQTDVAGVPIAAGDEVLAVLGSANRDEAVFDDPDSIRIDRDNLHLSFGFGAHFCVGASLARMEGATALRGVVEALPRLTIVEEPHYRDNFVLRGVYSLRMGW